MKLNILVTNYNGSGYLENCLFSVAMQTVPDWRCWVMDDCSTDKSLEVLRVLQGIMGDRLIVIKNEVKKWQVGNYDQVLAFSAIADDEICIELDSDDWLADRHVLERIVRAYQDPQLWTTWGQSLYYPYRFHRPYGSEPLEDVRTVRNSGWWAVGHLHTWRAFLWRNIEPSHLRLPLSYSYIPCAGDRVAFVPMLEMAGNEHARFLPEVNYIYNMANPLNEYRVRSALAEQCAAYITTLPVYPLLQR